MENHIKNPLELPALFADRMQIYPYAAKEKLAHLHALVVSVAQEDGITDLTESLKWGEPSYTCQSGSTIRMDWKKKTPDVVYVFFHCQTSLIETFRELFADELRFEGKRAVVLPLDESLPADALSQCISMALRYHQIKHLPLLGYGTPKDAR